MGAPRERYYGALQLGCPVDFYEGRHDPDHSAWLSAPKPFRPIRYRPILTRGRDWIAAGEGKAEQFKPADLEEWFAVSPTTAQDWLRHWQEQGALEPARPGQRIRVWRVCEPWASWVFSQPQRQE